MAKPSAVPRWADTGGDVIEPTSGEKDVGWLVGVPPAAQVMNWLFYTIYLWTAWLNDGLWEAIDLTLSGDLSVTNVDAVDGAFSGDVAVGGDLDMQGDEFHTNRVHSIWFGQGKSQSGSWTRSGNSYITGTSGSIWEIPLPHLRAGDRIKAWAIKIAYDGGTDTFTGRLMRNVNGTVTTVDTATSSTPGIGFAGPASFGGSLTEVLAGNYWLEIEQDSTVSTMRAYGASVTHDRVP